MNDTINWDEEDSKDVQFSVYPDGEYTVRVKTWERVKAKTGTPQIRWKAVIESGEFKNSPITEHTPLTEKSMWRVATLVKSCGIVIKGLGKMDVNSPAFANVLNLTKGRTTIWKLIVEKGQNGKDRNSIEQYITDPTQETIEAKGGSPDDVPDFLK